jgi:hypothetical protein
VGGGAVLYVGDVTEKLGDKDGTCPWEIKGGGALLCGFVTIRGLGEYDGTCPVIVWGTGAEVSGGNASGGCKFDPVFLNQNHIKTISRLVNNLQ